MWDTSAMGMGKGGGDSCDSCGKKEESQREGVSIHVST